MVSSTTTVPKPFKLVKPHIVKGSSYPALPESTFAAGTPKKQFGYEVYQADEKDFF